MNRTQASYLGPSSERLASLARRSAAVPRHNILISGAAARLAPHGSDIVTGALFLALALPYHLWGLLPAVVGGAVCAFACGWAYQRYREERPVWLGLAVGCAGLTLGHAIGGLLGNPRTDPGGLSWVDLGFYVFATGAAAGLVAWPEIRSPGQRLAATLMEIATLAAALALWGSAGFPPLFLPPLSIGGFARSGEALLPVIAAALAVPQLSPLRRSTGQGLGVALFLLLVADLLESPELWQLGHWTAAGWILQASGFALLFRATVRPRSTSASRDLVRPGTAQGLFLLPGILGVTALIGSALGFLSQRSIEPAFAGLLGVALCAREALRLVEWRRESERLAASVDLESRLLRVYADVGPAPGPRETLQLFCCLAAEVLKANSVLAWLAEPDALVLGAAGPDKTPLTGLLGRRLPRSGSDSLAARVFRRGEMEAADATLPGARVDRFLTVLLDAGPLLGVPVTRAGETIGALVLVRGRGSTPFSAYDRQKAAFIAAQAAGTLHRYELYQEVEDQLRETTLIHRFAVQAVAARQPNDIAWYLLESTRSVFAFDRGAVYLADRDMRSGLTPVAHFHTRAPAGEPRAEAEGSHLTVPLQCGDAVLGCVELHRANGDPFTTGEQRVSEALAQQTAVAIQNLRLQEASGKVSAYQEVDRLKTDLLNAVSHDLRGPLANIKGYASTLVDASDDMPFDEQVAFLRTIEEEADRLRDLLEHLLDLSKIDAGMLRVDLQAVQVGRIITEALSATAHPNHALEQAVPDGLFAMADRRRLRQVLHNLIENAIKYSPEGGLIRIGAMATQNEVTVSVSDHGVGIPRHQWDRIFRPYQRADNAKGHAVAGNGLGLAICKGIIEAHGGRIWVESEPNRGSTFSFTVPRAPAPESESEPPRSEPGIALARR